MQAPVLLRLAFHDAATHEVSAGDGGANASVQYEFSRPENTGLKRGWCDLALCPAFHSCNVACALPPTCLITGCLGAACKTLGCHWPSQVLKAWLLQCMRQHDMLFMCRRVIEQVMQNLKGTVAEGRVSYADLIALGGAYAVSVTGGPVIDVPIGTPRCSSMKDDNCTECC